jgi:Helix-turn-helix of DDE superfamily endonuclease
MTYEQMKHLPPEDFKRACGVHPQTFETMLQVLRAHEQRKVKPGRPSRLSLEDQLCMTLQYWREYRTYFHIGLSWGVDESIVCRTVHKIENLLIKSKVFHVPGKKKLCAEGTAFAVIVVDVAESPVERPQKNSGATTAGRKSATPKKPSLSSPKRLARSSVSLLAKDASTISNCSSAASLPSRQRSSA